MIEYRIVSKFGVENYVRFSSLTDAWAFCDATNQAQGNHFAWKPVCVSISQKMVA